jgi:hypothetical protein
MAERDEGFLRRWSRLKQDERNRRPETPAEEAAQEEIAPAAASAVPDAAPGVEAAQPDDPNANLPPIESLDRNSDYTAFLRPGVAPELKRQALGKLWRSDPVFANLDGLLEYGEDFSAPFKNRAAVATLYRVGKGMMESVLRESTPPDAAMSDATAPSEAAPKPIAMESPSPPKADSAVAKSTPRITSDEAEIPEDDHRG